MPLESWQKARFYRIYFKPLILKSFIDYRAKRQEFSAIKQLVRSVSVLILRMSKCKIHRGLGVKALLKL